MKALRYQRWSLVVAVIILLGFIGSGAVASAASTSKYLIFHLDAISTDMFVEQIAAGQIPNIERFFAEGHTVLGGLSLWPGGTEVIYPRLKQGQSNAEHPMLGWQYLDRNEDRWVWALETMLGMFLQFPRRARMFTLYAHPPAMDVFASIAMQNVPRLLQQYDVVEVLWFSSDHAGHVSGRDAQLASLYRFDRSFGHLLEHVDLDDVNVILYSDHGMSFSDTYEADLDDAYVVPIKKIGPSVLGEELRKLYYPNVYLYDPDMAPATAATIVREADIDWAFYWLDETRLLGLHKEGTAVIEQRGSTFSYQVQTGPDYFGYDTLGYDGDFLDPDQWLELTVDSRYPGAIPNIFRAALNENAGEVLLLINPPRIAQSLVTNVYNHKGVNRTDLLVPILLRGPDLEHLADVETMWLHELYTRHVPNIPFDHVPDRERHQLDVRIPYDGRSIVGDGFAEFRFSPRYRWRMGAQWDAGRAASFVHFDVFSTYISRFWLGLGLQQIPENNAWQPSAHIELEWQYGQWGAGLHLERFQGEWELEPALRYFSQDYQWSVELASGRVGLRRYW